VGWRRLWPAVEAGKLDEPAALAAAMREEVDAAPREMQIADPRPPRARQPRRMAHASVKEQSGAGLDHALGRSLSVAALNAAYNAARLSLHRLR